MNITQIKSQIGIEVLNIQQNTDPDTKMPTDWVSHWEDSKRIRVSMHKDVFAKILADRSFDKLAVKKPETVLAHGEVAEYTRYMIITPTQLLATF